MVILMASCGYCLVLGGLVWVRILASVGSRLHESLVYISIQYTLVVISDDQLHLMSPVAFPTNYNVHLALSRWTTSIPAHVDPRLPYERIDELNAS